MICPGFPRGNPTSSPGRVDVPFIQVTPDDDDADAVGENEPLNDSLISILFVRLDLAARLLGADAGLHHVYVRTCSLRRQWQSE